jgi:hypothetical protein
MPFSLIHRATLAIALLFSIAAMVWASAIFLHERSGAYPIVVMGATMLVPFLVYRLVRFRVPS